jgi:PadR family transcriptional regulator AphA
MAALTTTSYAILGLLSLRSWTTYDLAEQMRRALGQFWPRAESGIYTEPKKLVEMGMAEATTEYVGQRARARYTITPKGRRALKGWVGTPGEGPIIEFEQLVKVFYAERGTKADLLANLRGVRDSLEERAAGSQDIPHEYLEQRGNYPERLPWLVLAGRFLDEFEQAVDRWATWAINQVEQWPEDIRQAEPAWEVLEEMAEHADAFASRLVRRENDQ